LKTFKLGPGRILPKDAFPGTSEEMQNRIDVTIPVVTALHITANQMPAVPFENDFDAILTEEKDISELKRENIKLRAELSEQQQLFQQNRTDELLQQISTLKEDLSNSVSTKNQFFEEYEQRFFMYQQKLKESEDKMKDALSQSSRHSEEYHSVKQSLATTSVTLAKESQVRKHLETEMDLLKQEFKLQLDEMNATVSSQQKTTALFKSAMEELARKDSSARVQLKQKDNEVQQFKDEMLVHETASQAKDISLQTLQEQANLLKQEKETAEQRLIALLTETNYTQCPICSAFFPSKAIDIHADSHYS